MQPGFARRDSFGGAICWRAVRRPSNGRRLPLGDRQSACAEKQAAVVVVAAAPQPAAEEDGRDSKAERTRRCSLVRSPW